MASQRLVGAVGQAGIEAEGQVGEQIISSTQLVDGFGQALAAIGRIGGERGPAAFAERVVGVLEALRRADDAVFEVAAFLVAGGG